MGWFSTVFDGSSTSTPFAKSMLVWPSSGVSAAVAGSSSCPSSVAVYAVPLPSCSSSPSISSILPAVAGEPAASNASFTVAARGSCSSWPFTMMSMGLVFCQCTTPNRTSASTTHTPAMANAVFGGLDIDARAPDAWLRDGRGSAGTWARRAWESMDFLLVGMRCSAGAWLCGARESVGIWVRGARGSVERLGTSAGYVRSSARRAGMRCPSCVASGFLAGRGRACVRVRCASFFSGKSLSCDTLAPQLVWVVSFRFAMPSV